MSYGPRCTVAAMFCFALLATTAAWSVNPAQSTPSRDVDQSIQSLRTVGGPGLEVDRSRADRAGTVHVGGEIARHPVDRAPAAPT